MQGMIEITRNEIDLYRDHADEYGYVFFILQK
jgi:hypothetical protein